MTGLKVTSYLWYMYFGVLSLLTSHSQMMLHVWYLQYSLTLFLRSMWVNFQKLWSVPITWDAPGFQWQIEVYLWICYPKMPSSWCWRLHPGIRFHIAQPTIYPVSFPQKSKSDFKTTPPLKFNKLIPKMKPFLKPEISIFQFSNHSWGEIHSSNFQGV